MADRDASRDIRRGADCQVGYPGEQRGQRDFTVEPGQWCSEAEVGAGGEAEVGVGVTADVEPVSVRENARIAVGGSQEQQPLLARRARDVVDVGVGSGRRGSKGCRRDQPQHFFYCGPPAGGVFPQRGERLGVDTEQVSAEREQGGCRLMAGEDEENAVCRQVPSVVAFGAPGGQGGHQVVGWRCDALVEQPAEVGQHLPGRVVGGVDRGAVGVALAGEAAIERGNRRGKPVTVVERNA